MAGFRRVWRAVRALWDKGVHFPVWGTCLGLEMCLLMLSGEEKVLNDFDSRFHSLPIYSDYEQSRLFKQLPLWMR
jgi:hypothetical protein